MSLLGFDALGRLALGQLPATNPALELRPALFVNESVFFGATISPTIGSGSITLRPGLFTNTNAFFGPTISVGALTLRPTICVNQNVFFRPRITRPPVQVEEMDMHDGCRRVEEIEDQPRRARESDAIREAIDRARRRQAGDDVDALAPERAETIEARPRRQIIDANAEAANRELRRLLASLQNAGTSLGRIEQERSEAAQRLAAERDDEEAMAALLLAA